MRYPVTATGSKEAFEKDWYIADGFGTNRGNYFHNGADINLKTGGDSDLNQELKAIANGKIVYYHKNSHPTTGYGRHLVYRIEGPWGERWIHYAHCSDLDFHGSVQDVTEGQIIARVGKSGTGYAHLHLSIFKVDPATSGGIDNIANTQAELHNYWEDPISFIDTWMAVAEPVPTPPSEINDQTIIPANLNGWGQDLEVQQIRGLLGDFKSVQGEVDGLKQKIENAKQALS